MDNQQINKKESKNQPTIDQKDKKITDLRSLLGQAKTKIEETKTQLQQKDKQLDEMRKIYEKKIKGLELDSEQIIKQYEERLLRYQKSLEESDQIVSKHQKLSQNVFKNYQEINKKIQIIGSFTQKNFQLLGNQKDNAEVVEELCEIQKCKEYYEALEKHASLKEHEGLNKIISLLLKYVQNNLQKRRELRLSFLKKQTNLLKITEEEKLKTKQADAEVDKIKHTLTELQLKYEKNIDSIAKSKVKMQEEKTNDEFVKQMVIKLMQGPKDASIMALDILSKVLKFSEDEIKVCRAKIK